jgi:hypothetical protein
MKEAISMQSEALWVRRLEHRTMVSEQRTHRLAVHDAVMQRRAK